MIARPTTASRPGRRPAHRRRASAAVELALLLPVLSYICVVTIDYSRLFFMWSTITSSVFDGAMYASSASVAAASTYADVQHAVLADSANLASSAISVTPPTSGTTYKDSANNVIAYVEVTVTYNFTTQFNYPGIPNAVTLSRKLRMLTSPS